ncbi:MAG: pilus assembly protein N-terminal domain-containing protein [Acidobacteria bacterium]|nr:pilus assembly protein N-terminal domain-containing protein [Acidobacteriota bacterium]
MPPAPRRVSLSTALAAGVLCLVAEAGAQGLIAARPPTADAYTVTRSQHTRLVFSESIERLAVGDADLINAELISNREVLVLGRDTGRTTLIVWFASGTVREYLFTVQRDLSVLQAALHQVHAAITVAAAPDRDALVLTGTVPDATYSLAAEGVARNYLDAGERRRTPGLGPWLGVAGEAERAAVAADSGQTGDPTAPATPERAFEVAGGPTSPRGAVINLLRLETLPALPEDRVREAIAPLGGHMVSVRRVLRGSVRNDEEDVLVLEGRVPNQVALVRILSLASQLFAGRTAGADDLRVVADEGGALSGRQTGQDADASRRGQLGTSLGSGAGRAGLGRGSGRLTNQIMRNLGRAKVIEVAEGRVLSFIEVADLPQVRVNLRLYEVNRNRLRSYNANLAALASDFDQPSLTPSRGATAVQGDQAARVGGAGATAVQNVLSFLGGQLLNEFQLATGHHALDAAFSLLERDGIARSLTTPSLTVLSGELAQFQVGGEVPVPQAFSPAFGVVDNGQSPGTNAGVFSFVDFVPFGVVLQVRPLVGDDDVITIDVAPQVVTPDAALTQSLRQTTGQTQQTTAFETRSLTTSARLRDGQGLLVAGLTSRNASDTRTGSPGLRDVPGLGWLFRGEARNEDDLELVIVVNPVILRDPVPETALWAFPDPIEELIATPVGGLGGPR